MRSNRNPRARSVIESVTFARQLKGRRRESGPESLSKEETNFLSIYEHDLSNVAALQTDQYLGVVGFLFIFFGLRQLNYHGERLR